MTVQQLIAELGELPPDAPVWVAHDAEGNGYAPMDCICQGCNEDDKGHALIEKQSVIIYPNHEHHEHDEIP